MMDKNEILKLIPNCEIAQEEIKAIQGEITRFYFDFAYGVTPSLFVFEQRDGGEILHRVRLVDGSEIAELEAELAELKKEVEELWVCEECGYIHSLESEPMPCFCSACWHRIMHKLIKENKQLKKQNEK